MKLNPLPIASPFAMLILVAMLVSSLLLPAIAPVLVSAQPVCNTGADDPAVNTNTADCNSAVDITELAAYLKEWHACGECMTDMSEAVEAFYFSEPCVPACSGKNCGDDGCGRLCGECGEGYLCNDAQQCEEIIILMTNNLSQFGITWGFNREYQYGQFANNDYWVVGPLILTEINVTPIGGNPSTPSEGRNGLTINPGTGSDETTHAYDDRAAGYDFRLLPELPLKVGINSSIVSTISLGEEASNGQPREPKLHTAAVLTVLESPPPDDSFRPPYVGTDKPLYSSLNLRTDLLKNLPKVANTPTVASLESSFGRVWLDHQNGWSGKAIHPVNNMPEYGRDMAQKIGEATLILNLDPSKLDRSKKTLLIRLVQLGIDLAGIADNGGSWAPEAGYQVGRKWPILFAGLMLDDSHLKGVGEWETVFQEDVQTFYVEKTSTGTYNYGHGGYDEDDVGLPEWGIKHTTEPVHDEKRWDASYREVNGVANVGSVLAAHLMGAKELWRHNALFDYEDRWWNITGETISITPFIRAMWRTYRAEHGCVWTPYDEDDIHSHGYFDCVLCKYCS